MKRRLLIVAVFLLAGAVVNVAVAWLLALRVVLPTPFTAVPDHEGFIVDPVTASQSWCQVTQRPGLSEVVLEPTKVTTQQVFPGSVIVEWEVTKTTSMLYYSWRSRQTTAWLQAAQSGTLPAMQLEASWLDPRIVPGWARPSAERTWGQIRSARGWPLVTLWHEAALTRQGQAPVSGGWDLGDSFQWVGPGHILPYRLIPKHFVINTLFYAAILWLLIPGPFALRRFIRRRRGLCPGCGYPMGELSVCTECGMALPGRTEATA